MTSGAARARLSASAREAIERVYEKPASDAGGAAQASALAAAHLRDAATGWSIGGFGAIGEFLREADEPCEFVVSDAALGVITPRGGIRYEAVAGGGNETRARDHEVRARDHEVRTRAYEVISARPGVWHHGVVFCIPAKRAWPAGAGGIAELGLDAGALREQDRGAIVFDLAVGGTGCRFCVRTEDAELIRTLREANGARLLDLGERLWAPLLAASPHRVVLSPLGRIEVYERITVPEGRTAFGPHTHLIPKLLRQTRGHSASIPVPAGMLPVLTMYPPNPVQNRLGEPKPFDAAEHAAFQFLLERFGDEDAWKAKRWLIDAVHRGAAASEWAPPKSRAGRTACRVAMRQVRHEIGDTPVVRDWAFEVGESDEAPGDEAGHRELH